MKFEMQMLVCLTVMVVVLSPQSEADVSCVQLRDSLGSCLGYLGGGATTQPCCDGLRVVAAANTTRDRREASQCLLRAVRSMRDIIDFGNAARLLAACGVTIPFLISPDTSCARVG